MSEKRTQEQNIIFIKDLAILKLLEAAKYNSDEAQKEALDFAFCYHILIDGTNFAQTIQELKEQGATGQKMGVYRV